MALWYVDDVSSNGNGSLSSPFNRIQYGLNAAQPGDTVYLRAGTYTGTGNKKLICPRNGTENAWITLAAYPQETPILDGGGSDTIFFYGTVYDAVGYGVDYIALDGLTFQNASRGIVARGNYGIPHGNYLVDGCTFHDIQNYAILFGNFGETPMANIEFKNNILHDNYIGGYSAEVCTFSSCTNFSVHDNYFYNGAGIFLDIYGGCHTGEVYNNEIDTTGAGTADGQRAIYLDTGNKETYTGCGQMSDIYVHNNNIYGCEPGISLCHEWVEKASRKLTNIHVYNNIINLTSEGKYPPGIQLYYENGNQSGELYKDVYIHSNTVKVNGASWGGGGIHCSWGNPYCSNLVVKNNIFMVTNGGYTMTFTSMPSSGGNLDASYNLIYGAAVYFSGGGTPSNTINANPLFVSANDFHLTSGSPAIDSAAATPNPAFDYEYKSRPMIIIQAPGYDRGAYEFGSAQEAVDDYASFTVNVI